MALSSYTLKNYRSFLEPAVVELRPLTLFFGYNNAGKSALLRALPLIAASVAPEATAPLALGCGAARGSTFGDLLPRFPASPPEIELRLEWDDTSSEIQGVAISIRDLYERRRQIVNKLRAWDSSKNDCIEATWSTQTDEHGRPKNTYSFTSPKASTSLEQPLVLEFSGLVPTLPEGVTPLPEWISQPLGQITARLRSLSGQVQWLTSLREPPARFNPYRGNPPLFIRPEGGNAADILAYDKLDRGLLLREVSGWYERYTARQLDVQDREEGFSLTLGPAQAPSVRINLADTGEGMAQVLPVLVAAAMARNRDPGFPSILALEQPELHLHPEIHNDLAEYFCEISKAQNPPQILIETHSENFLLQVQLQIAEGNLPPDKVLVYWIRQLEDGRSLAERITFDDLAQPQGPWPPGLFTRNIKQARDIIRARQKRAGV